MKTDLSFILFENVLINRSSLVFYCSKNLNNAYPFKTVVS